MPFQVVHDFPPLPEKKFSHIVKYSGNTHNFNFVLTADQVAAIMKEFMHLDKDRNSRR